MAKKSKKALIERVATSQTTATKAIRRVKLVQSLSPRHIETHTIDKLSRPNGGSDAYFERIRNQARNLSVQSALLTGYFSVLSSEVLGDEGLVLDISTPDAELNKRVSDAWFEWELSHDFEDIEAAALYSYLRDGEAFVRLVIKGDDLSLELLDPAGFKSHTTGERIKYAIERDDGGNAVAYHYTDEHYKTHRISAKEMIYLKHNPDYYAVRGISVLAPVIMKAVQVDELLQSELARARLQSELTGFIKEKDNPLEFATLDGDDIEEISAPTSIEVGKMQLLRGGLDVEMIKEYNPVALKDFIKTIQCEIARALSISYATLTGDLTQVNFSSIRQGALIERRSFKRLQKMLARRLHSRIFIAWLNLQTLSRNLTPAQAALIAQSFCFKGQGFEAIDPTKDAQAVDLQLKNGTKTYAEVLRERGKELDTHIAELLKEEELFQIIARRTNATQNNTSGQESSERVEPADA